MAIVTNNKNLYFVTAIPQTTPALIPRRTFWRRTIFLYSVRWVLRIRMSTVSICVRGMRLECSFVRHATSADMTVMKYGFMRVSQGLECMKGRCVPISYAWDDDLWEMYRGDYTVIVIRISKCYTKKTVVFDDILIHAILRIAAPILSLDVLELSLDTNSFWEPFVSESNLVGTVYEYDGFPTIC